MGAPLVALVRRALEAGDLYGPAWRALRRKDPLQAAAIEDPGEWTSAVAYAALLHEVTGPAGVAPGAVMTVRAPDGRLLQVQVPAGAVPGSTIQVAA